MKIKAATATGCPVPQFVVTPETEEDRMLLRAFCLFRDHARERWTFHMHGVSFTDGEIQSMNFGWLEAKPQTVTTEET